ncbi:hypothetical protein B5X24_HaOG216541 [Helicoverpa armigera]|nr:hypothetical protein B5X24_HaOG216541 [Helicoverpa armigera]
MCRTVHGVLQTVICGVQMLVRVVMTMILMIENVIRMVLQTLYNFISFLLQMISLIPICVVFMITARLKCFMCGGGGPCPVARGGICDAIMSCIAILIIFFIFRSTGVLDKIFYNLGYAKAKPTAHTRFIPTPGEITECSRNDTDSTSTSQPLLALIDRIDKYGNMFNKDGELIDKQGNKLDKIFKLPFGSGLLFPREGAIVNETTMDTTFPYTTDETLNNQWTTILYYLE